MVHGALGEFDPGNEGIGSYLERFDFYCEANGISAAERKKAVFLSTVGHGTFDIIKDLLHPVGLSDASLAEIRDSLLRHFKPQSVEIAERFKFFKRTQQSNESVSEYIATLRKMAKECNFGDYLNTALRDQLVCGMKDVKCQRELLSKSDLTLESALQQAKAMEAVQREASCFSGEVAAAANRVASGPQRTIRSAQPGHRDAPTSADSAKYGRSCWRCGNRHGGKCRFESAKCYACGRQGHISRCCRQQASSVHHQGVSGEQPDDDSGAVEPVLLENLSTPSQPVYVVNRAQVSSPPIWCPVQICSTQVNMELDTGAGVTLIDEHTYRRFQKRPKLNSSPVKLRSFTGNTIPVLGEFSTDVTYNGRLYRQLPIVVVHGSAPCLLGRNWLEKMQICWSDVHALRTSHLQRLKSKQPVRGRTLEGAGIDLQSTGGCWTPSSGDQVRVLSRQRGVSGTSHEQGWNSADVRQELC
ncbi:uncharacterized protein LOC122390078 isoform X8 [Amphibalanus amphitrite]|uniref:uncharacterized protein LOC122365979 isoform X9 n=1 Tax=Amphibalanus amphitrite TaxID=1232801 RepID=UPI001C90DB3B|nr:uncharacterized protein LOC122365979 isoform X9 [Amphibalanus amphitrite]XP_043198419.1 uncharacterized protein LOC122368498 isoform X9 [Amphibalanus amphitrite]XP_043238651.1 uncharacterized protein LOC122390078 isoform X8 [Amphibalanus amphitrite]